MSVQNSGTKEKNIVHIKHSNGCDVHVIQGTNMVVGPMNVYGSKGQRALTTGDSYYCFKRQLDVFVHWLRTGEEPFPFEETVELMKLVIGGLRSRAEGGRIVYLDEIKVD